MHSSPFASPLNCNTSDDDSIRHVLYSNPASFFVFGMLCLLAMLLQLVWEPGGFITGIFVPDNLVTYKILLKQKAMGGINEDMFTGFSGGKLLLFYLVVAIHPWMCYPVNILFLLITLIYVYRFFATWPDSVRFYASLGILANFYLFLGCAGPNKESIILPLTAMFAYYFIKRKYFVLPLFLLVLMFPFRSGYAIILFGYYLSSILFRNRVYFACWFPVIISMSFSIVMRVFPPAKGVVINMLAKEGYDNPAHRWALNYMENPLISLLLYIYRIIANWVTMAVRLRWIGENEVSLLGFSYYISGTLIFISFGLGFYFLLQNVKDKLIINNRVHILSSFVVYNIMAVSVILYVHPRYLFPALPFAMGFLGLYSAKRRHILIGMSITGCMIVSIILFFFVFTDYKNDLLIKPGFLLDY